MKKTNKEVNISKLEKILNVFAFKFVPIVSEIVAVGISLVASVLGFFNIWEIGILLPIFFAVFAFLILFLIILRNNILKFSKDLDLSIKPNIDRVFTRLSEEAEGKIIKNAYAELLLLQETGSAIIEKYNIHLKTFIQKGGKVKIITCSDSISTITGLLLRNANLNNFSDMDARISNFTSQMNNLCFRPLISTVNVTVRYCPYPVAITAVISNLHPYINKMSDAVIRWADFDVPYNEKLDIYLNATDNPSIFNFYAKQFEKYNIMSYKKIIITGEPHIGKTTIIRNIVEAEDHNNPNVFFILSEEIIEGTERVGYSVKTSNNSIPIVFAQKKKKGDTLSEKQVIVSDYIISVNIWDDIADQVEKNKNKIIIVDEIGHMQLKSAKFSAVIQNLINIKNGTIIGSITLQNDENNIIKKIKNNINVECINIDRRNRSNIFYELQNELAGSIRLYNILQEREKHE